MDYYRGIEFDYAPTDDLFNEYAVESRFDIKETIFVKRMLQTVLPERLRNTISSNLFEKYVGVSEEQLAYELYMTEEQIRTMKRHGMFIVKCTLCQGHYDFSFSDFYFIFVCCVEASK